MTMTEKLKNADAAVLYIAGQSNAHAHAQALPEEEKLRFGLKHVFTLDHRIDRSLDNKSLIWRQFTSEYNNLGEHQDDTATLGYYTALEWEKRIEQGEKLPDLYIVQISIGAQGVANGMWNMEMEKKLVNDDVTPVPLYHLAMHIYSLVYEDLKARYKNPAAIGWHWIGSESDAVKEYADIPTMPAYLERFFDDMFSAIGFECPAYFYKLAHYKNDSAYKKGIDLINDIFNKYLAKHKSGKMVDCTLSPYWNFDLVGSGIYNEEDKIHYLSPVQKWFADQLFVNLED